MSSESESRAEAAPAEEHSELRQARILAVDNERSILTMLAKVLAGAGFPHVRTISDSVEALAQIDAAPPDLLLLDLRMQAPDGFAILQHIDARVPGEGPLPVLILTGDHSLETKRRALAGVARDLLTKPFDPREVVIRSENLLRAQRQHRLLRRQHAESEERLRRTLRELNHARLEAVRTLGAVADSVRADAAHHHRRVAELSELLAERLGLNPGAALLIRHAALLHDVGKAIPAISAPDGEAAFDTPALLHDRRVGQSARDDGHAARGGALLAAARSPYLRTAHQVALGHHEHWDGSGAPAGHAGKAIPLPARIVAVANAFDHLTHGDEPAARLSREAALARIHGEAGSRFDPAVVQALGAIVPAIRADLGGSYLRDFD